MELIKEKKENEGIDTKTKMEVKEKGERLFDAKRADLYDQSCDDIDSFARDIEAQIETEPMEELKDLTSVIP